ncbi:ROK family transcriptional regulator [Lacticaseibacillus nasuensis]|uniref:Transcriptional regulator sugar kinase, xylose operon regulator n=1 Tax=Lacticaseibacillus nasuensis JCM 17158 TaxID=1291734 RepID=A0A0R1JS64_9LACO|nr:ROK family transcriptional regulator [Lacticaseibacillus nasuensis]KRK73899.1 transcriptional regulator sugar kinase, xylose operon regulator [Lacticaseibacillus nasuensis JCM 17158]
MKKETMRRVNVLAVLNQIYNHPQISRAEISRQLGLNKATVSDVLKELIAKHLVVEVGEGESSDSGGRKPLQLQLNADYAFTISVDFGYHFIAYMINDLAGHTLDYERVATPTESPTQRQEMVRQFIQAHLDRPSVAGLAGIVISVHGIVHNNQVLYSPHVKMADIDLHGVLTAAFHVPVVLENEANLSAIYERDFAERTTARNNLITLSIHHGIGAGIIINNALYRGRNSEAGEIGHTTAYLTPEGQEASFEEICTQAALFRDVKAACQLPTLTTAELHALLAAHDPNAERIVQRFRKYLLVLIRNLILSFSPSVVVLTSDIITEIPELLSGFPEQVTTITGQTTNVEFSTNPYTGTLLGGTAVLVSRIFGLHRTHSTETTVESTDHHH